MSMYMHTILMMLVNALAVVLIYFFCLYIYSSATVILVNSFMMELVFKKYMPVSDRPPEETGKDEWYLE